MATEARRAALLNIDMDLLRTFVTVAELHGVTRAADRLGRSQPAISLQLQRLESLVGTALFHRNRQGLVPTETGQLLRGYAERILGLNDEAVAQIVARKTDGTVRVGLPNDYAVSLLPESLGRFSDAHLDSALTVSCALSTELLAGLDTGAYDLVVAMTSELPNRPAVQVWQEELAWVGQAHLIAEPEKPVPLIVYPEGCIYRERMVRALNNAGRPWRMVFASPSLSSLIAAARSGLGLTVLSRRTVPAGLAALPGKAGLPPLDPVWVGLYRGANPPPAAQRLVDFLKASFDPVAASAPASTAKPPRAKPTHAKSARAKPTRAKATQSSKPRSRRRRSQAGRT
jgi:DNA-binding transcriptional LysR family regulator